VKYPQSLGLLVSALVLLAVGEAQGQWTAGTSPGDAASIPGGQLYLAEDAAAAETVPDTAYAGVATDPGGITPEAMMPGIAAGGYTVPGGLLGPSPATVGPCPADADGYCCPPTWYIESGLRAQARNRPHLVRLTRRFLETPAGLVPGGIALHTNCESFDGELGESLAIGRFLGVDDSNRNQFVELRYWATHDWETDSLAAGVAPITLYGLFTENFAGFADSFVQRYEYDSSIYNFEANWWLRPRGRPDRLVLYPNGCWRRERNSQLILSYMLGLRYVSLNEDFHFVGQSEGAVNNVDFEGLGRYSIDTSNHLFGFQVGADLLHHGRNWSAGLQAKAAPLLNVSDQDSLFQAAGDPRFLGRDASWTDDSVEVGFLGEFGAVGKYFVSPDVEVFASYDLAWLFGVALAAEQVQRQIPADTTPEIRDEGVVFMHGLTMGVQFHF
jgi:hypothetical protein